MRGIFGRIGAGLVRRSVDPWSDSAFTGALGSVSSATSIAINQQTALQATAVMSCVRVLSEDVSKMTPVLYRGERKGERQIVPASGEGSHPLVKLLRKPAPWLTWPEFCRMMMVALLLRGNAYAVIIGFREPRGVPRMLVPINPDHVGLWQAPDGRLFWMVTRNGLHLMAVLREMPLLIPYEEMLHLKDLSANGLVGMSPISLAREAIALSLAQEQQYAQIMGNGARPSGVLTTDQKLTPEIAEALKQQWKDIHGGVGNHGKTAVLEAGLKWQALTLTMADLEFLEARRFQLEEIARIFRVPLHMIASLQRSTNNNIAQQSQDYLNNTLTSHTDLWEKRFELTFWLDDEKMFVDFDESAMLKADQAARYNAHRIGILTGFKTVNEVRLEEGLPPDPDGDKLLQPLNLAPLGSDQTGQGGDGGGRPPTDEPKV